MTHPRDIPTDKLKGMFLMGFLTMKKLGEEAELWPFTFAASQIREELKKRNEWDSWITELGKNKGFMNGERDYQSLGRTMIRHILFLRS